MARLQAVTLNIGLCPVVKRESDAIAVYDTVAQEIVATAPDGYWPLRTSKALRENGSGNKCVYLGWPLEVTK